MALSESALSELLDAFRAGEGVDLVRDAVRLVLQELIEVEATEVIGAGRYQRAETRTTDRNGHRPRLVATQAGDVDLRIPKLRKGSFFPSILELSLPSRRRSERGCHATSVLDTFTRRVHDLADHRRVGQERDEPLPTAAPEGHDAGVAVPGRELEGVEGIGGGPGVS